MLIRKLNNRSLLIKPPVSEKIKSGLVILKKGEQVGKHITENKEEIIIILLGKATILVEDKKIIVKKNHLVYIGPNKKHNIKNESSNILKYIYIVCLLSK